MEFVKLVSIRLQRSTIRAVARFSAGIGLRLATAVVVIAAADPTFALDFKLVGDLDSRMNVFTNQAQMYRASETIGSLAAPGTVVDPNGVRESWAEIKYRLAAHLATDDQKVKGVVGFEWGAIRSVRIQTCRVP